MSDQTPQKISESPEDGEDLCCDLPHDVSTSSTQHLQQASLSSEKAQQMAEFLGFLADSNRLRILSILSEQEMCVGDLAIVLEMTDEVDPKGWTDLKGS
jgi:ArsR family transcriptional regulator, lead/cadmium/zinc/bismuth-responsive transcriptional repressor